MKLIKELGLAGTKNGKITVGVIEEPYGVGSGSVASIAISLSAKSTEPDWKVHLPKENIDDVIAALTEAKKEL
jgi:diaminopimelate epimerase